VTTDHSTAAEAVMLADHMSRSWQMSSRLNWSSQVLGAQNAFLSRA